MANESMRYETILVFNSSLGEEAVTALGEKFKALIAEHGTIEKVEDWGKRRLAYPIEDEMEGYYILIQFESGPDFPAELNRVCEITEGVLRTLIVRNEFEAKSQAPAAEPVTAAAPAPAEKPAPAEAPSEPASVEEAAAPEEAAPIEEVAPAEEPAAPAEETAPVEEAAPAEETAEEAPAEEEAPAGEQE